MFRPMFFLAVITCNGVAIREALKRTISPSGPVFQVTEILLTNLGRVTLPAVHFAYMHMNNGENATVFSQGVHLIRERKTTKPTSKNKIAHSII
jgi:hypothetical protein